MNLDDQCLHFINQISNSKSKKKIKKQMFNNLIPEKNQKNSYFHYNDKCCICLDFPNVHKVITPCNHMFCNNCLYDWMKINNHCPVCMKKFS